MSEREEGGKEREGEKVRETKRREGESQREEREGQGELFVMFRENTKRLRHDAVSFPW